MGKMLSFAKGRPRIAVGEGAIYAGIQVLMREMGIEIEEVRRSWLGPSAVTLISSALTIGLFPHLPNGEIISIDNAASEGARLALVSEMKEPLRRTGRRATDMWKLSAHMDFQDEFIMALNFPQKS